jgi:hypothetical protein
MASALPPSILAIIDWLVSEATRYDGKLHGFEKEQFISDLMERTYQWRRDRVPPAAFSEACISAGLFRVDTEELVGYLRERQDGKQLVLREGSPRKGWTFDGVLKAAGISPDDDDELDIGEPSENW